MNWVNLVLFTIALILIVYLGFRVIVYRSKIEQLLAVQIQLSLDKTNILARLEQELNKVEESSIEKSEGFLKFISDSRDWAFQYIEQVQEALVTFDKEIEPILETKTGGAKSIDKIAKAFKPLQELMPERPPRNISE